MKKYLTFIICLIVPFSFMRVLFLRLLGHEVHNSCKIGINFILINNIILKEKSSIGYFNFIKVHSLFMGKESKVKNLNYFKGPLEIKLQENAGIGNQNKFRRAYSPLTYGSSVFVLGTNSHIAANHFFDITKSILFGNNSQVAGINSQFWTHGYYHDSVGSDRIRIDGEISIGNNVYVGSGCIFNPGVKVSNAIHIGSGSVISKNLEKKGMYVNQGLRFIENDIDKVKSKTVKVEGYNLMEEVYTKK